MAARALLFDLDGTIWDSLPWYARLLHDTCGVDSEESVDKLRLGISVVSVARAAGLSKSRFGALCAAEVGRLKLYPTVRESLRMLAARRTPMGVVTNLPEWLIGRVLERLGFTEVFTVREFGASKPSPTAVIRAAKSVGIGDVKGVYYVGDQEQDARAAVNAGLAFAWASYGYGRVRPQGTAVILEAFRDVLGL